MGKSVVKGFMDTGANWHFRLHEIIYESNTRAGKAFDVPLLVAIFTSIIVGSSLLAGP